MNNIETLQKKICELETENQQLKRLLSLAGISYEKDVLLEGEYDPNQGDRMQGV